MSRAEHMTTTQGRRKRSGLVPAALGLGLAVLLAGCGAGQITQTDTEAPAVNGASGTVGHIAVRNAQLAYPRDSQGAYQPGATAPLYLTIVNTGLTDDRLINITTPAALRVTIDGSEFGTKALPGNFSVTSGSDVDDTVTTGNDSTTDSATATPSTDATPTESATDTAVPPGSTDTAIPPSGTSSATPSEGSASPSPTAKVTQTAPGVVRIELVGLKSVNGGPLRAGLTIPITFYFANAGPLTITGVPIGAPADNSVSSVASAGNG